MIYATIVATSLGGIAMPAAQALITHRVSPREQGRVQGALTSVQNLASIFGPLIGGYVFAFSIRGGARFHVPGMVYFVSAVLALLGTAIAVFAVKRRLASMPAESTPDLTATPP